MGSKIVNILFNIKITSFLTRLYIREGCMVLRYKHNILFSEEFVNTFFYIACYEGYSSDSGR